MSTQPLDRKAAIAAWIAQLLAAAILGMTLPFKFTAHPESVALFEKLGAEPWGRLGTGGLEALAVVLLLIPRTAALGGALVVGLMSGALFSHATVLGVEVDGDGGQLLGMAATAFAAGATTLWLRRTQLPVVGSRFDSGGSTNAPGA